MRRLRRLAQWLAISGAIQIGGVARAEILGAELRVNGMSCPFCAFGIEKKLLDVEGVTKVEVLLDEGLLHLEFRPENEATTRALAAAVDKAGFELAELAIEVEEHSRSMPAGRGSRLTEDFGFCCSSPSATVAAPCRRPPGSRCGSTTKAGPWLRAASSTRAPRRVSWSISRGPRPTRENRWGWFCGSNGRAWQPERTSGWGLALAACGSAPQPPPALVASWGRSGSALGELSRPTGIAVAASGEVAPDGTPEWRLGSPLGVGIPGSRPGWFRVATGIATDAVGGLYVADFQNHRIQVFDRNRNLVTLFGQQGRAPGAFEHPTDLNIGPDGRLYVVDFGNDRLQVFAPIELGAP